MIGWMQRLFLQDVLSNKEPAVRTDLYHGKHRVSVNELSKPSD